MQNWESYKQNKSRLKRLFFSLFTFSLIVACGGGGSGDANATNAVQNNINQPHINQTNADIKVLMMGNSHTHYNQLSARLEMMLRAGNPNKTVAVVTAPASLFLDEHLKQESTLNLLKGQQWNFVILQAQKYSSSGKYSYSIAEAISLVGLARQSNAVPVLFPEWSRNGIAETDRILENHIAIAKQAPACIAPIGQAWDIALQRNLPLYSADGNHSVAAGAQLTAYILYASLTGKLPSTLPNIPVSDVSSDMQGQLRLAADEAVTAHSPFQYCPQDKPAL